MAYTVTGEEKRYRLNEQSRTEAILQNIALILGTAKGTVPLYRGFGMDTTALDLPLPAARARLMVDIKEAIAVYEPRAEVLRVRVESAEDGRLKPIVEVDIKDAES